MFGASFLEGAEKLGNFINSELELRMELETERRKESKKMFLICS